MFMLIIGCGGGGGNTTASVPANPASPNPGPGNSVTLTWDAPTTNIDGTPLTDLAGYKIYYGTSSGVYTSVIDAKNVTTYKIGGLVAGAHYFTVTAYNAAGYESDYARELMKMAE
jgi:hypothetical protein